MSKRVVICTGILLLTIMALLNWAVRAIFGPRGTDAKRIVAQAVAPDGTELSVVQRRNPGNVALFNTLVYFHKPGKKWEGFYYKQQDFYWDHAATEIDQVTKRITVFRHGKRT